MWANGGSPESYCGAPPLPAELWARWNLDPLLIGTLVIVMLVALRAAMQALDGCHWSPKTFVAGWAIGAAALISPLCALSVSLFSARVGQHMILAAVVAPLIAIGLPPPRSGIGQNSLAAAAAFTVALWVWHSPSPYAATFASPVTYWAMHLTVFGTALWLSRSVVHAPRHRLGVATAATLLAGTQMALLGAAIAFARSPLYAPHWLTTRRWGLAPLQDQQLGGAIMWIPAGLIVAAAIVVPLGRVLRDGEPSRRAVRA